MNIGVVFPQIEIGGDPAAIRDYAQAVDAMGSTHILAFDHWPRRALSRICAFILSVWASNRGTST